MKTKAKITTQNLGAIMVLASALMFGSYGVWSRLIGADWGNFFQGWTRALIIVILLIPIAIFRKEIVAIKREDWKWLAVFLVFTSLTQAPLFYAFNHMDIGSASLLFFVSMFLTMYLIGFFFLGEKFTKIKIISSIIAIVGMYLVFQFSITIFAVLAVVMAIINGIASGGEVASSKKLSNTYSPLYLVLLSWFVILVTNGIISVVIGEPQIALSWSMPWFWQLCYAIASLLGFWFVIAGIKYIEASIGALIGLLEIVFSVAFGIIIFSEKISTSVGIGALLIIIAAALPHIMRMIQNKQQVQT